MNKNQFIEKWGFVGGSKPVFDMRNELKKDLEELLADQSTSTYISGADEETTIYKNGGWFTVIDHT